jgi:large subunit ribosomal protein L30
VNKGKKIEGEKVNLNIGIKMTEEKQINKEGKSKESLTAVIRISGMVKVPKEIENALYRLKLRRKYSCIIIDTSNKSLLGLLKKVRFYVAYGEISKETQDKLIKQRGKKDKEGKLKPFFRLHPPRKGINSKLQYPKGVLGNNKKDINKLIERML